MSELKLTFDANRGSIFDVRNHSVAFVSYNAHYRHPDIGATLAAAPDLLAALKLLLLCPEIADCAPEDKDPETDAAERIARAAIARAEGAL